MFGCRLEAMATVDDPLVRKLKALAAGEAPAPAPDLGGVGFVLVPIETPTFLQVSTDHYAAAFVRVFLNPDDAEEFRRVLEPIGEPRYRVLPIRLCARV